MGRRPQQSRGRRHLLWSVLFLVLIVAAGLGGLRAQQTQTTVTVAQVTAAPGQTKTVSVAVANAPGVVSIQGSLSFNTTVVRLANLVFASGFVVSAFNVQSGSVRFVATLTQNRPAIQNGGLFHIEAQAVGQPGQSSPLNLTLQFMGDVAFQEIPRTVVNGSFTITAQVTPPAKNQPPVADFSFEPKSPTTNDTVRFLDHSRDPDGRVVSWQWNFGDGQTASVQTPSHRYAAPGSFTVKLTVSDNDGASDSISKSLTVKTPASTFTGKIPQVSVFPNPAGRQATFRYRLPQGTTKAILFIFNLPGAGVLQHDLALTANQFRWDLRDAQGRELPDGPYFYFVLALKPGGAVRSTTQVLVIQR